MCCVTWMESIRLPIRDLNLDGFSCAEVREVSHCVYIDIVESSSRCSGDLFHFVSIIRFVL